MMYKNVELLGYVWLSLTAEREEILQCNRKAPFHYNVNGNPTVVVPNELCRLTCSFVLLELLLPKQQVMKDRPYSYIVVDHRRNKEKRRNRGRGERFRKQAGRQAVEASTHYVGLFFCSGII